MSTTHAEGTTAPRRVEIRREDLQGLEPVEIFSGRNGTKADVRVYRWAGSTIAVKDYGERSWPVRQIIGRYLLSRETAAYAAAGRIEGLARFVGRIGPHALATEFIDARPLPDVPDGGVNGKTFDRLRAILDRLHERGVALSDLHQRDVLVADDGDVFVVDLATAWVLGPRPGAWRRRVFRRLCGGDLWTLTRLRRRYAGETRESELEAIDPATLAWHRRTRRLKLALDRVRGVSRIGDDRPIEPDDLRE